MNSGLHRHVWHDALDVLVNAFTGPLGPRP